MTAPELLAELDRVLRYPKLHRYHTDEKRKRFVALVMALCEAVDLPERIPRISRDPDDDRNVLLSFEGLNIALRPVNWQQILPLALRFDRSAHDAAYLALAEKTGPALITGDRRLYNAVHEHLDWVQWLGDYTQI